MDFSEQSQKALLQLIAVDCFKHLQFKDSVKVSTKLTLLVDQLTEYEYDFQHTVLRDEEALFKPVDREVQTDSVEDSIVTIPKPISFDDNSEHAFEPQVEVKVERESDVEDVENDMTDDPIDYVKTELYDTINKDLPNKNAEKNEVENLSNEVENLSNEVENLSKEQATPAAEKNLLKCNQCPSEFADEILLKDHVRVSHPDCLYFCPVCLIKCNNAQQLADHIQREHCKVEPDESVGTKRNSRRKQARKNTPRKVVVNGESESDTDEGYMDTEYVPFVKKLKKSPSPKKTPGKKRGPYKKKGTKTPKAAKTPKKATKKVKEPKGDDDENGDDAELDDEEEKDNKPKSAFTDPEYKSKNGEVKCKACDKTYLSKRALRRHYHVIHGQAEHICEICGHSFRSKESLFHHRRGVHENLKAYKCEYEGCGAEFNFSHSLRLHRLKHTGARPHMCNVCGKTYLTAYHLKVHMQASHTEHKNFGCRFCSKKFSYTTSLKLHEATHGRTERVKCDQCEKSFVNTQAMKYHVMTKHTEPGHFPCDECGKVCKNKHLLRCHQKRHSVQAARFMCDVCGKCFMYRSALEMHRAVHKDEKTFMCKTCGKCFKTYPTLYSHQYVHREDYPFTCETCNKTFKTKERLKAHEKRHSGLKPFKCELCDHRFPDKGGLSKHLRTVHCKVKKFVCDICGKATSRADNLRVHMKVHMKGTEYRPPKVYQKTNAARVIGPKKDPNDSFNSNLPSIVSQAIDAESKKVRTGDFYDDQSDDSQGLDYGNSGYEPNMPQYPTVDTNQIAVSSATQDMPLNLHQNDNSGNSGGPLYIAVPESAGRTNPQQAAPPQVSNAGGPNQFVAMPLQPSQYLYSWHYPYPPPPTLQPPSSSANSYNHAHQ